MKRRIAGHPGIDKDRRRYPLTVTIQNLPDTITRITGPAQIIGNGHRFLLSKLHQLALRLVLFSLAVILLVGCSAPVANTAAESLHYNQSTITALDRELTAHRDDKRYGAVLRGLRWCIAFCDNDPHFDFTFTNYVTMLDELTLQHTYPALEHIVHVLILREFERALPRFHELFTADVDGYEDFISILPIAYHHRVPVGPLKKFALRRFANVASIDRAKEFRQAAKDLNYDLLTDLIVEAAFVDMAYTMGASKDFRLPLNNYGTFMDACAKIPFLRKYNDNTYSDQNYYATHVLLALNHYGQQPLKTSATRDHVFLYLADQYDIVRNRVGDIDLLCEYLYCFRQCAQAGVRFIAEGEKYVMSLQNSDGSWGTAADFNGDPYDQLHPTWTVITLLVQKSDK
jgi:hypothetical protein